MLSGARTTPFGVVLLDGGLRLPLPAPTPATARGLAHLRPPDSPFAGRGRRESRPQSEGHPIAGTLRPPGRACRSESGSPDRHSQGRAPGHRRASRGHSCSAHRTALDPRLSSFTRRTPEPGTSSMSPRSFRTKRSIRPTRPRSGSSCAMVTTRSSSISSPSTTPNGRPPASLIRACSAAAYLRRALTGSAIRSSPDPPRRITYPDAAATSLKAG